MTVVFNPVRYESWCWAAVIISGNIAEVQSDPGFYVDLIGTINAAGDTVAIEDNGGSIGRLTATAFDTTDAIVFQDTEGALRWR